MLHEGMYYTPHHDKVKCVLCPHHCVLKNHQFGLCSVRKNEDGKLKTINYGEISAISNDPIEKKPLFHFKPNGNILSVGTFGCNFSCKFCQNYRIAFGKPKTEYLSPQGLVETCLGMQDTVGIAFTYNEPTIWYEYVYETAKKLKETNPSYSVVLVTNGYIELEPLRTLLPYVDAMNIDLKSFQQEFYKTICGGSLHPVLKTIEEANKHCHVEVTTLLVNGLNDAKEEVAQIASFLAHINKSIPLHLSRYFKTYQMDRPDTELDVILQSRDIAKEYLDHVYVGNVANVDNSTYCPTCGERLVSRKQFGFLSDVHLTKPTCNACGETINIIL